MSESITPRPRVAVAFHSGQGHTAVLAEAVRRGAEAAGADVAFVPVGGVSEEQWEQIDAADAVVFGSPTYMGGASSVFHGFAEATLGRYVRKAWADKLAAGFTNSSAKSGDKLNTLNFLAAFAAQHHMIWVGLGLSPGWNKTTASEEDMNRLGFFTGAGAQTPADGSVETVHPSDIATAEHLGRRIATQAATFAAGRAALAGAAPSAAAAPVS
ncbi:flavodoxin family protein [Streptomyces liangshanensis]|uniref:Flavodoxin family protein n=1 Tax=Streptomyces liangshanensis TaxID=2717324 RepID=A0A6G9GSP5_9ACTN|nr:flavodoxin family protein [Streptomyces liangshanensis]QIQ01272.1 flavodoxin family protein [Streptomyces liangshanensis]